MAGAYALMPTLEPQSTYRGCVGIGMVSDGFRAENRTCVRSSVAQSLHVRAASRVGRAEFELRRESMWRHAPILPSGRTPAPGGSRRRRRQRARNATSRRCHREPDTEPSAPDHRRRGRRDRGSAGSRSSSFLCCPSAVRGPPPRRRPTRASHRSGWSVRMTRRSGPFEVSRSSTRRYRVPSSSSRTTAVPVVVLLGSWLPCARVAGPSSPALREPQDRPGR